jgi:hypothetical protein
MINITIPVLKPAPNMPSGAMLAGDSLTIQTIPSAFKEGADLAAIAMARELYAIAKKGDLAELLTSLREAEQGLFTINGNKRSQ